MSIVTLKKKSAVKYNNMSVNTPAFSINGTHRNQGFVGQNVISRSLPRTTVKSHGGCCGTFPFKPIIMSSISSTEDSTVIKSSVLSTRGMIEKTYAMPYYNRPYPCSIVKPDATMNMNQQSSYIAKLVKTTLKEAQYCVNPFLPVAQSIFNNALRTDSETNTIEITFGGVIIFTGVFTTKNNSVTHFYDLSNPSKDIFTNNGYHRADSIVSNLNFSDRGTNITSFPYFENLLGISGYHNFHLTYDGTNNYITVLDSFDFASNTYICGVNIEKYNSMMYNDYNNYIINYYKYHPNVNNLLAHKGCGVNVQSCHKQMYRSLTAPGRLPKPLQYTKDPSTFTSISQSQYILSLDKKCSENDIFTTPVDGIYGKKTSLNYPIGC